MVSIPENQTKFQTYKQFKNCYNQIHAYKMLLIIQANKTCYYKLVNKPTKSQAKNFFKHKEKLTNPIEDYK